ncbi:MAG: molybdopterin-guanine dinucleotide biosynthesis protein MobB [Methanomicrobiales archaeon]|nr:molybdopterin-guanine dinucleotide biosynthesis protein MobB [Methanomicrobiales archaeon]
MKVIPVAGTSGSGKTSFILALIPLLSRMGPVGTVKHVGHHAMEVPEGKDTTVMFATGARAVAGIDLEKTIVTLRSTSVIDALDLLAGQGVAFAVVEGFKGSRWPKIVIGDLEAEGILLRNPSPEDVIRNLDRFPDYVTLGELLHELGEACREQGQPCTTATATIPLPALVKEDSLELPALVRDMEALSGIRGARAAIRHGALFGGADELIVAVAAGSAEEASSALQVALPGCLEDREGPGNTPG